MIFDMAECEEIIGYRFNNKMLLREAFTYASYIHEHQYDGIQKDNELLEFFGDAVIQFVVTEYLYKNAYGDEGKLTDKRKLIVSREPLYNSVKSLGLDKYLLLGKGQEKELKKDGKKMIKFVSSVYESVVAAIYLDGGIKEAKKFIKNTIINDFERLEKTKNDKVLSNEMKNIFQEFVQKNHLGEIKYKTLEKIGPDHLPEFREAVYLNGKSLAEGKGKTKKQAQSSAAKIALEKLKKSGR